MSIAGIVLAYIPLTLEKRFPELVKKNFFKINRKLLYNLVIFNLFYSISTIIVMLAESPDVIIMIAIFYLIAMISYVIRLRSLFKKGLSFLEICKKLPDETIELK